MTDSVKSSSGSEGLENEQLLACIFLIFNFYFFYLPHIG